MNSTLLLGLFVAIGIAQITEAVSIRDVITRIATEQTFLDTQVSNTKTSISEEVSSRRSMLNSQAESIKTEMKNGLEKCKVWIDSIETVQKTQINFLYYFQLCEKTTDIFNVKKIKSSLFAMKRNADQVQGVCQIPGYDCQGNVNKLNNGLDLIHNDIVNKLNKIKVDSNTCIDSRSESVVENLERPYNYWKECQIRA